MITRFRRLMCRVGRHARAYDKSFRDPQGRPRSWCRRCGAAMTRGPDGAWKALSDSPRL